jgi:dihydrofolate synthase/folylpolyglutamate synthase
MAEIVRLTRIVHGVDKLNYTKAVEYVLNIPKFTKKNPMDNIRELMEELGNLQNRRKVIHVAGTNGKGSVCAFMASVLGQAGKSFGLFTSPHLIEINERFIINGNQISNEDFEEAFHRVLGAVTKIMERGYAHPTFFEYLFAMAMVLFDKAEVEFVILETGMGGRLDATNIVEHPVMTVITTIGLDHTEILGDTIEKITYEKAGIIKPQVPVVFDGTNPIVSRIIETTAVERGCSYNKFVGEEKIQQENEFSCEISEVANKNVDFLLKYGYYGSIRVCLGILGDYQIKNSALAIQGIRGLACGIDDATILKGIEMTKWPGRMEEVLPEVYVDGAHNGDGISEFIKTVSHFEASKKILLFSAVIEKDYHQMIKHICEKLELGTVVVTELDNKRAVSYELLKQEFEKYSTIKVYGEKNVKDAFQKVLYLKAEKDVVFCVGSLYLVGEIKSIIRRLEHDRF